MLLFEVQFILVSVALNAGQYLLCYLANYVFIGSFDSYNENNFIG